MELVRFFFKSIDGNDTNIDIFALVKYPDSVTERNKLTREIEAQKKYDSSALEAADSILEQALKAPPEEINSYLSRTSTLISGFFASRKVFMERFGRRARPPSRPGTRS